LWLGVPNVVFGVLDAVGVGYIDWRLTTRAGNDAKYKGYSLDLSLNAGMEWKI
jgi:hypothetical protein